MKCRLDEISDGAIKDARRITLPDGTSGLLAGTYVLNGSVVLALVVDGARRWVGPLAGDLVATITKEE